MTEPRAQALIDQDMPAEGVRGIYINRPQARNAMTTDMWVSLRECLARTTEDRSARAVVIGARGDFFSAGGDLKSAPEAGVDALRSVGRLQAAHQVLAAVRRLPIPVVAAVPGGAVGLGWGLVMACDIVVAGSGTFFSAPFVQRGLIPDGGVGWFLARRLGSQRAAEILMSGRRVPAEEALALGLVQAIADDATARAIEMATKFADGSRDAIEQTKRLLRLAESVGYEDYLDSEAVYAALGQTSPDASEGRRAFAERRRPVW